MRTIIAGSRGADKLIYVAEAAANCGWKPTVVISGTARGADKLGEEWAKENGISIERYPAEWDKYGKSAGYIRNELMASKAEALIALWDGESKGTGHMIAIANAFKLKIFIYYYTR
jgi:hypothetical protein